MNDNDLHPVRFTNKQVALIKHIMGHFSDYFEDEAEEFFKTIEESEKDVKDQIIDKQTFQGVGWLINRRKYGNPLA